MSEEHNETERQIVALEGVAAALFATGMGWFWHPSIARHLPQAWPARRTPDNLRSAIRFAYQLGAPTIAICEAYEITSAHLASITTDIARTPRGVRGPRKDKGRSRIEEVVVNEVRERYRQGVRVARIARELEDGDLHAIGARPRRGEQFDRDEDDALDLPRGADSEPGEGDGDLGRVGEADEGSGHAREIVIRKTHVEGAAVDSCP